MRNDKWDRRFMELAEFVSRWSRDPSTKCGAVIVRPDLSVASIGYNKFPRGMSDAPELYADRPTKLSRVIHAEMHALLNAHGESLRGATMYNWPPGWGPSCDRCAPHVIQAGITTIVNAGGSMIKRGTVDEGYFSKWRESCLRAMDMYREAGVEVVMMDWE